MEDAHWLIRLDRKSKRWVIDLVQGADRICLPVEHGTHQEAMQQAQMLYRASLVPIVDRN